MDEQIPEFMNEDLKGALTMLESYKAFNIHARTFMLQEHSLMLEKIIKGVEEPYSKYTQKQKNVVISRVYIELFERICQSIEDFTTLCTALGGDLADFQKLWISQKNPQNTLKSLNEEKWELLFRHRNLEELNMSGKEKDIIKCIRIKNVQSSMEFVELLQKFLDLHWVTYTKIKHGNTVVYGYDFQDIMGEQTLFIPAVYNSKSISNVQGLFVNQTIYTKWKILFNKIILLTSNLVEVAIEYIKRGLVPFVLPFILGQSSLTKNNEVVDIIKRYELNINKYKFNTELHASISNVTISKFEKFYALPNWKVFE